jgi:hypothetical protein
VPEYNRDYDTTTSFKVLANSLLITLQFDVLYSQILTASLSKAQKEWVRVDSSASKELSKINGQCSLSSRGIVFLSAGSPYRTDIIASFFEDAVTR